MGRQVQGVAGRPHHDESSPAAGWSRFPTIDPQTVLRSARALERYGPDFTYSHYLVVGAAADGRSGSAARPDAGRPGAAPADARLLLKLRAPARARRPKSARRVVSSRGPRPLGVARVGGPAGRSGPRSRAAIPATARPRRCSPSRRCAWPSMNCRRVRAAHAGGGHGRRAVGRLQAAGIGSGCSMASARWTAADIPDQSGRTAVVTGANSGLGLATARELARAGAAWCSPAATRPRATARRAAGDPDAGYRAPAVDRRRRSTSPTRVGARVRARRRGRARSARSADQQRRHDGAAAAADRGRVREPVRHQPPRPLRLDRAAARRAAGGAGAAGGDRFQHRAPGRAR